MPQDVDLSAFADDELDLLAQEVANEKERRSVIEEAPSRIDALLRSSLRASKAERGDEWVQPTGGHDAYPKRWVVSHNGKTWESTTPSNVWEPGTSGWRELPAEGEAPAEWVQPTGAHDAYMLESIVTHSGAIWASTMDANVWEPGGYNWRLIENLTPQIPETEPPAGVDPPVEPEPEPEPTPEPAAPAWTQPAGAHDAYTSGAVVTHNGQEWTSTSAANIWEPGVFGWTTTPVADGA